MVLKIITTQFLLTCLASLTLAQIPSKAWSGAGSLFIPQGETRPLVPAAIDGAGDALERRQSASLFGAHGLFNIPPERFEGPVPTETKDRVALLRDLIAKAEAGPMDYDAVQYGARVKPGKPPTQMTVAEIFAWIKATPGQPHAIGRYQFIPDTLAYLVKKLEIPHASQFDRSLQDRLADELLIQAGLNTFLAGEMDRVAFMNRIARVWAGFPTSSGRSHYHGYAGNKATISWATFEAEMVRIFGADT